jgi:hypothetical protein
MGSCDGIVRDGAGNYYVSAWTQQSVYKFDNSFASPVAVVTGLSNPADIYYNLADDSLVCPNASNSTVTFHYMGSSTSVEEIDENNFTVFPNPATKQITIYDLRFTIESVDVFDLLGNKQITLPLNPLKGTSTSIDVSSLSPGIYFVKVKSERSVQAIKFMKQ